MAKKKKDPTFHWDESVANFITIRWDVGGELEIDLGSINHYEALSVLKSCWEELETRTPPVCVRFNGKALDFGD